MNNFQKLAQLNRDIELLENAGKFDAAEVLQRKFLKEAQADAYMGLVTQDAKNFMMQLDQAYNSGQPTLAIMQKAERAGLSPQELQVLKNHAAKIKTQSNNDFNSQYPNTGYQTAEDTPATPARMPKIGPAQLAISTAPTLQPMTERSDVPQGQQQPAAKDNFQNNYTEQSDAANLYQQQNSNPNAPQENAAENQLYSSTINEIKKLLATGNEIQRNYARGLYQETRTKFKNLKRQSLFDQQYSAIERNPNKKQ
jgi:hypothetical protein